MPDPERVLRDLFEAKAAEVSPRRPPYSVLRRIRVRQFTSAFTALAVVGGLVVASVAGLRALTNVSPTPIVQPTSPTPSARSGGSITLGTRDYPQCLNPLTACASNTGTWWTVLEHVLPRAMELDASGDVVPSPLLTEAPSLENRGLTENPFTVTLRLDPEATWADGTPITSSDIDFTWRAIMHTTGSYQTAGYDQIISIDATDPATAVISFKALVADWADLFGGAYGGILEEAAFPGHLHDPAPDLANEMQADIPFSGGPWRLESFAYPGKAVLVPNDRYFGRRPLLERVTIVSITDAPGGVSALKSGLVDAASWPADEAFLDQLASEPDIAIATAGSGYVEGLWFNHQAPPLDDSKVREALMYAIDRQAVVDQVLRSLDPAGSVLNCGLLALPGQGPWCQTKPFAQFAYDPERARRILESDGYDCSSLPCTKDGAKLVLDFSTTSTNDRRVRTQQLLAGRALAGGFQFRIRNTDAATLFGTRGPRGAFGVMEYAIGGTVDPSVTGSMSCEGIPSASNGYVGGNWIRWCDQEATDLMHRSDGELDRGRRLELMSRIYAIEARDFVSLPLFELPILAAWRTDRIAGPIGDFAGSPLGLFFNMDQWSIVAG